MPSRSAVAVAVALATLVVLTACRGDGPAGDGATTAPSSPAATPPPASTTSAAVPSVPSTLPSIPAPLPMAPVTTRPGAVRLVGARPSIEVAQFLRPGERTDGDAVALPGGDVLVAVRTSELDHCDSQVVRIAAGTGARTVLAAGVRARLAPDGRRVAYARPVPVDDQPLGCAVDELVVRDLASGDERIVAPSTRARAAFTALLEWSPDGSRLLHRTDVSTTDATIEHVTDVATSAPVVLSVAADLDALMQRAAGAVAAPCHVIPVAWLTDGRIAAALSCVRAMGDPQPPGPAWWIVPSDGVLRSFDDAATGLVAADLDWRFAPPAPHLGPMAAPPPDVGPWLREDEWVGDVAMLPNGEYVVGVRDRARFTDTCTSRLVAIDPVAGTRAELGEGGSPSVSPDGRLLLWVRVRHGGDGCDMVEVVARSMVTGVDRTLYRQTDVVQAGVGTGAARWSPDGSRAVWFTGWEFSEGGIAVLYDLAAGRALPVRVDPAFAVAIRTRLPRAVSPDGPCEAFPGPFLADGRLTVSLTCDGLGDDFGDVPRWYAVPDDGVVRSFDSAITDRQVLGEINRRLGCRVGCDG